MYERKQENSIDKKTLIDALERACEAVKNMEQNQRFFPFQLNEDDIDAIIVSESENDVE
jgi:ethanolamine utilization protein EutQ (cupin superfamily)